MSLFAAASRLVFLGLFVMSGSSAWALDLDWHGQFRAEENVIYGFTNGVSAPANNNGGYTIPNSGDSPATFQNLFLRLNPRVLVNDNVTVHTDLWVGTPDQSFFGSDGRSTGTRSYYSTTTGNAAISAHTLFAEVATDFGTVRVGRLPLNWGLGLVWNSKDDGTDRLPSSGDGISMTTKLGAFSVSPAIIKYVDQNNNPGALAAPNYNAGVTDYTISLTYKNDDEQVDLGILFLRRIAGINSNVLSPFTVTSDSATTQTVNTYSYAYNIWDFYAKKRAGVFTISAEVPLVNGTVSGIDYSTVAGAVKAVAKAGEHWSFSADIGSASGQTNGQNGATPGDFSAFSFSPDYRPGFILFNYNLYNIAVASGSPYNDPVTNAKFLALGAKYTTGKWSHAFQGLYALADQTADGVAGNIYFNSRDGHYETEDGSPAQSNKLGFELDYGLGYQWDESIRFGLETGLYFPGAYYDFNNTPTPNTHSTVFASNFNVLVKF